MVLPETDLAGSYAMAERLRGLVSEKVISTPAAGITITASFGISCFIPGGQENPRAPETLLDDADQFMYQAKAAGRNRVVGPPDTAFTNYSTRSVHVKEGDGR